MESSPDENSSRAERDVSSRLDHPNIIKIFDTTVEKDYAYIVMEYFPGTTLEQYCTFQNLGSPSSGDR